MVANTKLCSQHSSVGVRKDLQGFIPNQGVAGSRRWLREEESISLGTRPLLRCPGASGQPDTHVHMGNTKWTQ